MGETTRKLAAVTSPKLTRDAPVKLKPEMVIVAFEPLDVGVKRTIVGGGSVVKAEEVVVPPGFVSAIAPLPETTTRISLGETIVNIAGTPPNVIAVTLARFCPVIVTVVPTIALCGAMLVITGTGTKINPCKVAVPPGVRTDTAPDAPFAETVAVISREEEAAKRCASTPPNVAALTLRKPVPEIVIVAPGPAVFGVKSAIVGMGNWNVNPASVAVPSGDVTEMLPDAPSADTIAVICDGDTTAKRSAGTPPIRTSVTAAKFAPKIVIVCPTPADTGVKLVRRGAGKYTNPLILPVPPGVETVIGSPALTGTTAVICVAEITVNVVAGRPPKFTAVAPVKFVPVNVITAPGSPLVGAMLVIVGLLTKVNPAVALVPPSVCTETAPDAPAATTAVICDGLLTVKFVAAMPPKRTDTAPVKFAPVTVTGAPVPADAGVNPLTMGAGTKVKPMREATPPVVFTCTTPVIPPTGTVARICVGETTSHILAGTPPNNTPVTPVKFVPVISTLMPGPALAGAKAEIVGAAKKVNPASEAVPPEVATIIEPDVAFAPSTAVICVGETSI